MRAAPRGTPGCCARYRPLHILRLPAGLSPLSTSGRSAGRGGEERTGMCRVLPLGGGEAGGARERGAGGPRTRFWAGPRCCLPAGPPRSGPSLLRGGERTGVGVGGSGGRSFTLRPDACPSEPPPPPRPRGAGTGRPGRRARGAGTLRSS